MYVCMYVCVKMSYRFAALGTIPRITHHSRWCCTRSKDRRRRRKLQHFEATYLPVCVPPSPPRPPPLPYPTLRRLTAFPTPGDPRRRPVVQFEWDEKKSDVDGKRSSRSRRKSGYQGLGGVPREDGRVPGVITLNPKMYWMPVSATS